MGSGERAAYFCSPVQYLIVDLQGPSMDLLRAKLALPSQPGNGEGGVAESWGHSWENKLEASIASIPPQLPCEVRDRDDLEGRAGKGG